MHLETEKLVWLTLLQYLHYDGGLELNPENLQDI